ncbi:MAG TPA: EamA family transporter [Bacillota bacterium]|nr:EamA family transporter [Bacillota bacterium]HOL10782.1 EamA family transporter [Bacillota bacterium]HPO98493.1 EamA family transporter [Bacillota bacterium]
MRKESLLIVLSYLTIYIVWGSTYFFIKMAVATIPSFYVVGFRWLIGGIALLIYSWLSGRIKPWPTAKELLASLILGTLLLIGGNGLVTIAEKRVDSYFAALVLAATPITVALFDRVLLKKQISLIKLGGIVLGLIGVAALLYNGKSILGSFTADVILILTGMTLWSLGTSLGHKIHTPKDVFVNSSIQMIFVGLISLIWAYFETPNASFTDFTSSSIFGLAYLTIFGSLAFCAYNHLLLHEPAIRITSYSYINPVIAVVLGLLVGAEKPVPFLMFGLPLILMGLILMLYGELLMNKLFRKTATSN